MSPRGRDRERRGSGIRRVFRIRRPGRDVDEELAFHFERTVEELRARGLSDGEARAEARRRFGDERKWRRELERIDRSAALLRRLAEVGDAACQTLREAFRTVRRAPGLAAALVLTFALGIGVNAAMFGVLDRLLLKPPEHVEDPGAVVRLLVRTDVSRPLTNSALPYPSYRDFDAARSLASTAAWEERRLYLGRGDGAEPVRAQLVTGSWFRLLGVSPVAGRFFTAANDRRGGEPVAVLGHGLWTRRFGGDPDVVGRSVDFGYGPFTVVGVAPEGFHGVDLEAVDLWLPLHVAAGAMQGDAWEQSRQWYWLQAIGRLAPGASREEVEAELTLLHRRGMEEFIRAERYDSRARVLAAPLIAARGPLASAESKVARWLAGVALAVLLVACANVANLLLARAIRREREIGIRLALGISRRRLVAQIVVEGLLLAAMGAAAALLAARWGGRFIGALLLPEAAPETFIDARVLLFTLALAAAAGVVAALLPAWHAARPAVAETLRAGGRGTAAASSRTRVLLTVGQAALSVVLLVGAGLFVRSLGEARTLDLGFEPERLLVATPVTGADDPGPEERRAQFAEADRRLEALPGIAGASASMSTPFRTSFGYRVFLPGRDSLPPLPTGGPYVTVADPDYLRTMGIRVLEGRGLEEAGLRGEPPAVVVNETLAAAYWPEGSPLGQCMRIREPDAPCATVVGVVEDAKRAWLTEAATGMYYLSFEQGLLEGAVPRALFVRAIGDPAALAPTVRRALLEVDARYRFVRVQPMRELIDPETRSWRLGASLFTAFGFLALVVAGVGLYSVMAYHVSGRRREIGIRAALGAGRERIVASVLWEGVRLAAAGVLLGAAAAAVLAPRVGDLLFETSPLDPWVYGSVAVALILVAAIASALPASRAAAVDPGEALRPE